MKALLFLTLAFQPLADNDTQCWEQDGYVVCRECQGWFHPGSWCWQDRNRRNIQTLEIEQRQLRTSTPVVAEK